MGEIVLMVMGILIALQINSWNENHLKSFDATLIVKLYHVKVK